jgi:hypothetical protein
MWELCSFLYGQIFSIRIPKNGWLVNLAFFQDAASVDCLESGPSDISAKEGIKVLFKLKKPTTIKFSEGGLDAK